MPRFTISSAISRPVHWLMGRPACSGASPAICSIWQSWSALNREGAPGRGKSSRRSSRLKSATAIAPSTNHRSRHKVAISTDTFSSWAISAWFFPAAALKMIRARCAFCCPVVCRAASFSNSRRSFSLNSIFAGFGPGISATFLSSRRCLYFTPSLVSSTPCCTRLDYMRCPGVQLYAVCR